MKSITKNRIDAETVALLSAKHFPGSSVTEVTELTGGAFNSAFLVYGDNELARGAVLKIGPTAGTKVLTYEKDILRAEVTFYQLLEGKGLPVPKVLAYDYSRAEIAGDYFFMTVAEGVLWNKADKKRWKNCRPELMRQLGEFTAVVHGITGEKFGYIKEDDHYRFDTWPQAFGSMMSDILEDGRKGGRRLPYDEILRTVEKHASALAEVKTPRLVDFDLWAGNVFLNESGAGYRIGGVIDFERGFFGDPYAEFAASSLQYLMKDIEKEPDFRRGYDTIAPEPIIVGESERIRMNLYSLYLAVIMNVETYRYGKIFARVMTAFSKYQISHMLKKLS